MKKTVSIFVALFFILFCGYSKELEGTDLLAVNTVLESNLGISEFETLEEKIEYLDKVANQIEGYGNAISDEAKLICKSVLRNLKETARAEELFKQEENQKKKNNKREKDPEVEAMIMGWFKEYEDFAQNHTDLSSHFYFHFKEAEFATLPYLSMGKQVEMLKNIVEDYRKIEEMNPDYGEILFTYGMTLYMAPKIAGGDKQAGIEKIYKATQVSKTNYEKVSAMVVYSQLLFEDKKYDEAKKYLVEAEAISPAKKRYQEIQEMNDAGYSLFKADEYKKKKK